MINFQFADLHCHPTLKTYGQSFSKLKVNKTKKSDIWYSKKPTIFLKCIQKLIGITRFSQADFTTMALGNVKLAFVSYYPFEKGFFITPKINNKLSAKLADYITSIGYKRIRFIQKHTDYFEDFKNEYNFLCQSAKTAYVNGESHKWHFINRHEQKNNLIHKRGITVIPTIEGAHIFNSGLSEYGIPLSTDQILNNVSALKQLDHPPLFMTFAHNFNNDLCGHAPSLEPLKGLVDQSKNLNFGFSTLGIKVLHALLSERNGQRIYIDIKHMSLKSRCEYYKILKNDYDDSIPIIVSHGSVTGRNLSGKNTSTLNPEFFANDSINFYDEELVHIAESKGLFAIQLDAKRLAPQKLINKPLFADSKKETLMKSTLIIWRQLQHVAEILDAQGLPAWQTCCIGSDFDGTIDPLDGIWTSRDFNEMANALLVHADNYLSHPNVLKEKINKTLSAKEVIRNFAINNTVNFLKRSCLSIQESEAKITSVRDYV